jgi:hypothetical protein
MSEESTTPDLVDLARRSIEAPDPETVLTFYAQDAVWDSSPWGMVIFEGKEAVQAFFEAGIALMPSWSGSWGRSARCEARARRRRHGGRGFAARAQAGYDHRG